MILFYSEHCNHCKILLETIKKHDKDNIIKLLSIELLKKKNRPINPKIHCVPALYIIDTKEFLFGKSVFDLLLLPNRGLLFTSKNTRVEKKAENNIITNINDKSDDDILAFSLGTNMSDNFSSLDEKEDNILKDKSYNWDIIDNNIELNDININNTNNNNINNISINPISSDNSKNLPSIEELLSKRNNDIL